MCFRMNILAGRTFDYNVIGVTAQFAQELPLMIMVGAYALDLSSQWVQIYAAQPHKERQSLESQL